MPITLYRQTKNAWRLAVPRKQQTSLGLHIVVARKDGCKFWCEGGNLTTSAALSGAGSDAEIARANYVLDFALEDDIVMLFPQGVLYKDAATSTKLKNLFKRLGASDADVVDVAKSDNTDLTMGIISQKGASAWVKKQYYTPQDPMTSNSVYTAADFTCATWNAQTVHVATSTSPSSSPTSSPTSTTTAPTSSPTSNTTAPTTSPTNRTWSVDHSGSTMARLSHVSAIGCLLFAIAN